MRVVKSLLLISLFLTGCATAPERTAAPPPSPAAPTPTVSLTPAPVQYLAVSSKRPAPEDVVPVADKATIRQVIDAAKARDQAKYNELTSSGKVTLVKGGTIVKVLVADGDLVQVKLYTTGEAVWTSERFLQTTTIGFPPGT